MKAIGNNIGRLALALVVGALALAGALVAPAQAGTPGAWNLGYGNGSIASTGDVITNTSATTISITITYSGAPLNLTCPIFAGTFTYTVPSMAPAAAPGGTLSIPLSPPSTITTCTESITGNSVVVAIPPGTTFTLNVTAPSGATPGPYTGTLSGSLVIPANSLTVMSYFFANNAGTPPCVVQGPTNAGGLTVPGTYATSTGVAQPSTATPFTLNTTVGSNPTCPFGTNASLSASSKLTLVGPSGLTPTLVYMP